MKDKWKNSKHWYYSHFPESQFLCKNELKKDYQNKIILGHSIAQNKNVLICGIVRNSESILKYGLPRIERLGSLFKNYHVYLYENDSTDSTKRILRDWGDDTDEKSTIVTEDVGTPIFNDLRGEERRKHMANARNKYLDFAREYCDNNHVNFLIILDIDIEGGWSYHGILNSFGHNHWDIIGSNSLYYEKNKDTGRPQRLYYDSWAYRELGKPEALEDTDANLFRFNRGEDLVPVNSCFGGLTICKPFFLYEDINYTSEDCDHTTIHNKLTEEGYKIFLNPSQITLYNKSEYMYDSE